MSLLRNPHVDQLDIDLWMPESPISSGDHGLNGILEAFETHAGELMPDQVFLEGRRLVEYSRSAAHRTLARSSYPIRRVWLERTAAPEAQYRFAFFEIGPNETKIEAHIAPFEFFQEPAHTVERSLQIVSLVRALTSRYPPCWGFAHSMADELLGSTAFKMADDPLQKLDEVYWLNVLGPLLVEGLGRARVLATPAAHLEELPNGTVLFLTRPTPGDFASDEARVAQAKALVHLRPHLSYDAVLAKLRQRSVPFIPVERDWDADIAPFLERTLKHFYVNKLNPRIAEYNRLRPPPPSEWLPLSSAPPSDVDDAEQAVDHYEGLLAERLAALLHQDVPEVMDGTPESLPAVDAYLWHRNFAGYERHKVDGILVPAVGAYLGKVLVYHLGGRWVPRRNLDEAQVIVGDRAWLPFLRARHHLQSQETAFAHSLTQLYRVAACHQTPGSSSGATRPARGA